MKILSAFLLCAIAFTSPALASDDYQPPDNGHPDTERGSGTRVFDCTYCGSDRREGCL
ncbi:MAG: hypothetical protein KME22_14230 [Hassallia sp. WJT32-NPBG1]|jgi:opacity protein-like surface antigen|nr:hypothetical protein [Hassallia sp. WJT32-NPBG1]